MKTVDITIRVEVPDNASHVAVDKNGQISYRIGGDCYDRHPELMDHGWNTNNYATVVNCQETLTEVK